MLLLRMIVNRVAAQQGLPLDATYAAGQRWPYALCGWFCVEGAFPAVVARVKPGPLARQIIAF